MMRIETQSDVDWQENSDHMVMNALVFVMAVPIVS